MTNPNMVLLIPPFSIFSTYCPWKTALAPFVLIDTAWLVPNIRRNDLRISQEEATGGGNREKARGQKQNKAGGQDKARGQEQGVWLC